MSAKQLTEKFFTLSQDQQRSFLERLFSEPSVANRALLWMTLMYDGNGEVATTHTLPMRAATPALAGLAASVPSHPSSASTAAQAQAGQAPPQDREE